MYYWNSKAIAEKILDDVLDSSSMRVTFLRICYISGPYSDSSVAGYRENPVMFPGHNPRIQFIHEDDVTQAFAQAIRVNMPGAFNVVPDDFIRLSDIYHTIGAKPRTIPLWLVHLLGFVLWRYFGSPIHPSWIQAILADFAASNAKLKATGWMPHYNSIGAISAAL
jgi:nucleoside-diphosphate-sugar epimerase